MQHLLPTATNMYIQQTFVVQFRFLLNKTLAAFVLKLLRNLTCNSALTDDVASKIKINSLNKKHFFIQN